MIKILIVDDELEICKLVEEIFKRKGYAVIVATNGHDALTIFEKENPQIVLVDIVMPNMNGIEVLKKIKKRNKETKVLMLTFIDDPLKKQEAHSLGANGYITKPFSTENLEDIVSRQVQELLKAKILIVEDQEEILTSLSDIITRSFKCEVFKAIDGKEAIKQLKEIDFDLVILDIKMPGINGLDVMKTVKKIKKLPDILVVTAWDSGIVSDDFYKEGIVDCLHKPVNPKILIKKAESILMKKGKLIKKHKD